MESTQELAERVDAALMSMEERRRHFQEEETRKYQAWKERLAHLGEAFERVTQVIKPRLEVLIQKFGEKVTATPSLTQSMQEVVLDFESDIARIRLRFQGTTDNDISKLILNYDLSIVPILMQFDSHSELEMPVDNIDCEAVVRWIDERIMSFVQIYISLHENKYYLHDQMVADPVSGTTFPRSAAGASLQRNGHTYYFISDETRREFERRNGNKDKSPSSVRPVTEPAARP